MRIPSGVTDQYIYFVAVDSTDLKTRETGLSSFTVYRSRNGGTATAYTTPTVAQLDATNMPGVYSLLVDEDMTLTSGNQSEEMVLHITQASMAPVTRVIEIYRPSVTAGETLTVASGLGAADVTNWKGSTAPAMTGDAFARIGAAGAGLTDLGGMSTTMKAQINTEADTALTDYDAPTNTEMVAAFTEIKGATWATTDTLEAIRDRGDAAWTTSTGFSTHSAADVWAVATRVLTANTNFNDPSAATIASAVMASNVEGTVTLTESMRLQNSVLLGKASGLATTTAVYRDLADSKDRVTATVDADGNRSAVTLDDT